MVVRGVDAGGGAVGASGDVGRVEQVLRAARAEGTPRVDAAGFVAALALLRQVREELAGWEPELIDAARAGGASWAQLAPALGVASRQAAERRALRLRPGGDGGAVTGEARVAAERDRRAGERAVGVWAGRHAADLRVLAAQVGGLAGLPEGAQAPVAALHAALGGSDPVALLAPLRAVSGHLGPGHQEVAARIDALCAGADAARADAADRRRR